MSQEDGDYKTAINELLNSAARLVEYVVNSEAGVDESAKRLANALGDAIDWYCVLWRMPYPNV